MAEQLLAKEVSIAAPLALRERCKLKGWEGAVYYLELEKGQMLVLHLTNDGKALAVTYIDKSTCQMRALSVGHVSETLSKGRKLILQGTLDVQASYPVIKTVFACNRELQTPDEVKRLRSADTEVVFHTTMYDTLIEFDLIEARDGTYFYATIRGQVFQCTLHRTAHFTRFMLEELFVHKDTPRRIMYLDQGYGPSTTRPSRRQNEGVSWRGSIGPFDRVFSSDKEMTPNEIRAHFHMTGRHQTRPR